ncbi:uncharacterized protein LTR77_006221 [Saxophila tyrrhenica]|uniref:Uncharacterized protein n=1 Tax=Saxophila tyrrhenica TaxID=1690608 RepID=A0AAV9P7W1_9PEZI|nr:hypothetical protein LTR77_006221 [Saxophila tyrrhenica]
MATSPDPLERNTGTGLTDSTHSSSTSSSAERYDLNELDDTPILLYKYRGGLQTSSQRDLCAWLDKDESLRVTTKPIPRYTSYLSIKRHDLYLPSERTLYADRPNFDSNLASIKVPSSAYWSRMFWGGYENLYIVSPESSPAGSLDGGSRGVSPTSSFGRENTDDSRLGEMVGERVEGKK